MVLGLGFGVRAEKDSALKIVRHFGSRQAEPGLGHIDETNDTIDGGSGFFATGVKMFPFFRNTDDQGTVDPTGIEEAFAPGEHTAMVRVVNDDGIFGQALFLQNLDKTADGVVDSADHAQVGAHVDTVLAVRVPAPEETFPVNGGLEEVGLACENLGVIQARRSDLVLLVHPVCRKGPGKMPDTGTAVAVLGMTGIEPHVQGKGLVLGLALEELDPPVHDQVGLVAERTIGLFLVKGIASDLVVNLEIITRLEPSGHLGMPLAGKPGPVPGLAQNARVEMLDRLGGRKIVLPGSPEAPAGQPSQDGRPADPADGLTDEGIGKARAVLCQTVDIRRLGKRMSIATERARGLIVSKEEDDIGLLGLQFAKEKKEKAGETEGSMIHDLIKGMVILSKRRANGNPYGIMNG